MAGDIAEKKYGIAAVVDACDSDERDEKSLNPCAQSTQGQDSDVSLPDAVNLCNLLSSV